jgi:peptidoglycan-N-acetylglucosamine deacetylase
MSLLAAVIASALVGAGGARAGVLEDGDDAEGPLDISRAELDQSGARLVLQLETIEGWAPGQLEELPAMAGEGGESYACFELAQDDQRTLACLGADENGPVVGYTRIDQDGGVTEQGRVSEAPVITSDRSFRATVSYGDLGLHNGRLDWRAASGWADPACNPPPRPPSEEPPPPPSPILPIPNRGERDSDEGGGAASLCTDVAPDDGLAGADLRRPRVAGCAALGPLVHSQGSGGRKEVALTFDDGPSQFTDQILEILDREHAKGTFFVLGQEIRGDESLLRGMLAGGHMVGNHTMHHNLLPSASDLASTSERIKDATGFEPCLFRPPYGVLTPGLAAAARHQGMTSILWDVDPSDYSRPGAGAIVDRVVNAAHPGSIVVMHDGGGPRDQTVEALPEIIHELEGRGYSLVTVTDLLDMRLIWRPR